MPAPRYKALVDEFAKNIRQGTWSSGMRLPTHRVLAQDYGIALATATKVYAELEDMGLVIGETGRGTYVRDLHVPPGYWQTHDHARSGVLDLAFTYPQLPAQADALRHALRDLATGGDMHSLIAPQPAQGRQAERRLLAQYLKQRGLNAHAADVVIVNGAQQGLALTVMALLRPGDVVAVDALTYPGFIGLAQTHRLELVPIPMTPQGPNLSALERLLRERPVKAIFTMPTLHNPMGWVMGMAARTRLVALARKHKLLIIEDGSYAFLVEDAPTPLRELAPERTVYVSGLSKPMGGGVRFGYLVTPPQHLAALDQTLRALAISNSTLITALCGRWLEDGTVLRFEAEKRAHAAERQALAHKMLEGLHVIGNPNSYFAWVMLPTNVRADQLAGRLSQHNILVATSEAFATSSVVPHAIRLSMGLADMTSLRVGLKTILQTITDMVNEA